MTGWFSVASSKMESCNSLVSSMEVSVTLPVPCHPSAASASPWLDWRRRRRRKIQILSPCCCSDRALLVVDGCGQSLCLVSGHVYVPESRRRHLENWTAKAAGRIISSSLACKSLFSSWQKCLLVPGLEGCDGMFDPVPVLWWNYLVSRSVWELSYSVAICIGGQPHPPFRLLC